jgi:hypothetical protein
MRPASRCDGLAPPSRELWYHRASSAVRSAEPGRHTAHHEAEDCTLNAEDDEEEVIGEVEISIEPREQTLVDLGITPEEFEAALLSALEERDALVDRDDVSEEDIPFLEKTVLSIRGTSYKLEVLADISIESDDDSP